jgi:hypothetical protein
MNKLARIEEPYKATLFSKIIYRDKQYFFSIVVSTDKPEKYIDLLTNKYINIMYFSGLDFQNWACTKLSKEEFIKELERLFSIGFVKDEVGLKSIAHYLI